MTVTEPVDTPDQLSDETLPQDAVIVICQEGVPTSDNRQVAQGACDWRDPQPLKPNHYTDEVAGVIEGIGRVDTVTGLTTENIADRIGTSGDYIVGLVRFDLGYDDSGNLLNPAACGREIARMAQGGFLTGASIEPGANAEYEFECIELDPDDPEWCLNYQTTMTKATIIATAMTPTQALDEAGIVDVGDAPQTAEAITASALERARWWNNPAVQTLRQPIVASAVATMPDVPPHAAFFMPEADGYQDLIVDGWKVYGHVAPPDVCHVGIKQYCQTCPTSQTGYDAFHQLPLRTDDGLLKVGLLCTDRLHTDLQHSDGSWVTGDEARRIAYENPGARAAYLRAIDGKHGLWVSGVLHPNVSPEQLARLEATPVSGEWFSVELADGTVLPQELIAINCVNSRGFLNIGERARVLTASINGNPEPVVVSMVAALGRGAGCGCDDHKHTKPVTAAAVDDDRLGRIERALAGAGIDLDGAELDALASTIGV